MGNLCSCEDDDSEGNEHLLIIGDKQSNDKAISQHMFVCVEISDVPAYLRQSKFYREIALDDQNSSIDIPAANWKLDDSVADLYGFAQLLRTMNFWIVDAIPRSVLQFCYDTPCEVWERVCLDSLDEATSRMLLKAYEYKGSIDAPIKTGCKDIVLHWLEMNGPDSKLGKTAVQFAAANGDLYLLGVLRTGGYPWNERASEQAAEQRHLHCLKYLHENGCPWNASVCSSTAIRGHLTCLQYAHVNGCVWDRKVTLSGYFHCLDYALQHGCPVHEDALLWAAQFGRIDCLRILCAHGDGNQLCESLTEVAASNGQVETLKFLIRNGCPRHPFLVEKVLSALRSKPTLAMMCLKYLVEEEGLFVDDRVFCIALLGGQLQCVQYLMENGFTCNFVMSTGEAAHHIKYLDGFEKPHLDECIMSCLQFISEHGATIDGLLLETIMTNPFTLCHSYIRDLYGFVPIKRSAVSGGEVPPRSRSHVT